MILTRTIFLSFCILGLGLGNIANAQIEVSEEPVPEETPIPTQTEPVTTPVQPPVSVQEDTRAIILQERTQARITNLAANISNRLDAYINRLQNIATRFGTRMDKLEATGVDVTIARASLARAQVALDAAVLEMSDIDERVAQVTGSPEPRQAWRDVQVSYLKTRDNIRTAFTELRTVLIDLRGALSNPVPTETPIIDEPANQQ